jgi:alanine-glyoxylate transaminase/serine-glyoxylate transaminase/serine-pyruvate transaminase
MAETSTGVRQPVEELGAYLKDKDTLLVVDTVTALAGINLEVDAWGIDICYSGSQKCLSVPPGASPITFSPKAMDLIVGRKSKIQNWYLDVSLLQKYWGEERVYHHTAPISMVYALYEGLRIVLEEGLEARFARHQQAGELLQQGLVDMGFSLFAAEGYRLPQLTTAFPPDGVDVEATRQRLLHEENIEVGGGLGPVAGKIWRIGLLGENARPQVVDQFLGALRRLL